MILSKNSSRIKMPCRMYIYHFFFKYVYVIDTKTQSRRLSAIDESAFFLSRDVIKSAFKDVSISLVGAPNFLSTNALKNRV